MKKFNYYGYHKKNCRLCKSTNLFKFLDLGLHPPSDEFKKHNELGQPSVYFPLELCSCNNCGFKQINYVVDAKYMYQNHYPYESSLTKAGEKHFNEFAESIIKNFHLTQKDLVIDIGSNIGVLLEGFQKKKIKIIGVDPAKNICKLAESRGIRTYNGFFDNKFINYFLKKKHKASIITATNVFAHIDDLKKFFINIKKALNEKSGVLVIESPHFVNLMKDLEYDTIYHEHLSYILIKPLIIFLKKFNLEIFDIIQKDIHGGSIRIFISKTQNYKIKDSVKKILKIESNAKVYSNINLKNFSKKVEANRLSLVYFLTKLKKNKKKIIAISAPAKGMTLINYCKIDNNYIDFITDKSKLKINRFTPGGNIPVFSDKHIIRNKPDYALLLAWNFSKEIISNNLNFLKNGGKFIIPIPKLKIIKYKDFK